MRTAIGVCPVPRPDLPAALSGPFEHVLPLAASLGFEAVELHLRHPDEVPRDQLVALLRETGLGVAALHTGRAYTEEGLSLSDASPEVRRAALDRLLAQADLAAELGGPVVIGLLRGRLPGGVAESERQAWLAEAIGRCAAHAEPGGTRVLIEPQNEPNLDNLRSVDETRAFIAELGSPPALGIMVDGLFAAVEGLTLAEAIRRSAGLLGGVQVSQPGRRLPEIAGSDIAAIAAACCEIGYTGCIGIECLPLPDALTAAHGAARLARAIVEEAAHRCSETHP
jgi:5-keto-L-gluconate epimerase